MEFHPTSNDVWKRKRLIYTVFAGLWIKALALGWFWTKNRSESNMPKKKTCSVPTSLLSANRVAWPAFLHGEWHGDWSKAPARPSPRRRPPWALDARRPKADGDGPFLRQWGLARTSNEIFGGVQHFLDRIILMRAKELVCQRHFNSKSLT